MQVLSTDSDYSVVVLDGVSEPCLALRSKTLFELINLLDSCRGFIAGAKEKEEAVAVNTLLDRLNRIAVAYEVTSAENGYELEVPKSLAQTEFARARQELDAIIEKLLTFRK